LKVIKDAHRHLNVDPLESNNENEDVKMHAFPDCLDTHTLTHTHSHTHIVSGLVKYHVNPITNREPSSRD